CSFGYVYGEGVGPAFSSDESRLGLAWATNPMLKEEDVERLPSGECLVDWATLRIQELPHGRTTSCNFRVRVSVGFPFEDYDSYYPERLEIVGKPAFTPLGASGSSLRCHCPAPSLSRDHEHADREPTHIKLDRDAKPCRVWVTP